jgi:hypothetical protein
MWLLTQTGLFSAVAYDASRPGPALEMPVDLSHPDDVLLIRARVEQDLTDMLDALELPRSKAQSTPGSDYAHRALLTRAEWLRFLSREVEHLDYPNFRARVLQAQGRERHAAYTRAWSAFRMIQTTGAPGQDGP